MPITLPNAFLTSLLDELKSPTVIGITLGGSFSRGQGTPLSDVDLELYVKEMPPELIGSLTLRMLQGKLISIHYGTLEDEYNKLTKPWYAIWAVPGLRNAVILHDTDDQLAELKQAATRFEWSSLQTFADRFASAQISANAEEVYKILSGLATDNESKTIYAVTGLMMNMAEVMAVQHGIMIETENRYLELVQETAGEDSEWTRLFRLALAADQGPEGAPAYRTRGLASLELYRETAQQMDAIILSEHRQVIATTLHRIQEAGY